MDAALAGKVVLVTGGSRGIGAAIVTAAAGAGAEGVVHYGRRRDAAQAVAARVGAERCHLVAADLATAGAATGLWQRALAWKGRIDVLVNNAGIFTPIGIDASAEAWTEAWRTLLQINLVATADLCREALRHFRGRGGGTIINVASRAAFRGDTPDYMHYAASKAGMVALTRSIARGFAADGVVAYALAPGFVRTEMAENFVRVHGADAATRDIPLGEMVPPEEVANVAVFLASGRARHAPGATIDINGASYVR